MELKGANRVSAGSTEEEKSRPRKYEEDFRQTALERMNTCQDVSAVALERGHAEISEFFRASSGRIPESGGDGTCGVCQGVLSWTRMPRCSQARR
jgi:hypothetical protein